MENFIFWRVLVPVTLILHPWFMYFYFTEIFITSDILLKPVCVYNNIWQTLYIDIILKHATITVVYHSCSNCMSLKVLHYLNDLAHRCIDSRSFKCLCFCYLFCSLFYSRILKIFISDTNPCKTVHNTVRDTANGISDVIKWKIL